MFVITSDQFLSKYHGCRIHSTSMQNTNDHLHFCKTGREIRPEDIGLTTVKGEDETQPFIVAFLKATDYVEPPKRRARDVSSKRRVKKSDYASIMSAPGTSRICKMHTLYISFKDLQWQVRENTKIHVDQSQIFTSADLLTFEF